MRADREGGQISVFLVGLVAIFAAANAPGIFVGPRIAELGATPIVVTPAEFARHIADETAKWAAAVKLSIWLRMSALTMVRSITSRTAGMRVTTPVEVSL